MYVIHQNIAVTFMVTLVAQIFHRGFFRFLSPNQVDVRAVAPFISTTDPSSGLVSYEIHQGGNSQDYLSYVSSIINLHENTSFTGTWLLVATWENVTDIAGNYVSCLFHVRTSIKRIYVYIMLFPQTNTFQGMLITNFVTSYAVFTYYCGHMSFSDPGVIGYAHTGIDLDVRHGASYRENPHEISCFNNESSPWVNVVYQISFSGKNVFLLQ